MFSTSHVLANGSYQGIHVARAERRYYKAGSHKLGLYVFIYRGRIVGVETGER